MKKKNSLLFILIVITQAGSAQTLRTYFGIGGIYHKFQDTRFSDLTLSKNSLQPEFGFILENEKNFYSASISAHGYNAVHPATDSSNYSSLHFNVSMGYLREIKNKFYLGGTWNLVDFTVYEQSDLENNNNTFMTSSDFLFSALYNHEINNDWKLRAGSDFGVLSFIKLAPSFTANFQQNVVDKGHVSAEDSESRSSFGLQYIDVKSIGQQLYLRTQLEMFYKRRLSLAYQWRMRTIWEHKEYPLTQAQHTLSLRYHFISR